MKVGVLGSGAVAKTLGAGFLRHGHAVMLGTRDPAKLGDWQRQQPAARIGSFQEAAAFAEVVVLAVKGSAALDVLGLAGAAALAGKPVLDATNPIAAAPPVNGVLQYFTSINESLMERLQNAYPQARFVKCFNSVGNAAMVNPVYAEGRPTMFICGNDAGAKHITTALLDQFGWETLDLGGVEGARGIEPLCITWCIPGMLHHEWTHAFKVLHSASES